VNSNELDQKDQRKKKEKKKEGNCLLPSSISALVVAGSL
jgi:hypothetical protein